MNHARVFGVPLRLDRDVQGLEPVAAGADGAPTVIREAPSAQVRSWGGPDSWPELATVPPRSRFPDAERVLVVGRDDSRGGFRLWTPQAGEFVVAPDGMAVSTCSTDAEPDAWERILFAQVLPLVAVLRGHEVLHASGVRFGDSAVALVGPSGIGKSTLSTHLTNRGGALIADDVLALAEAGDYTLAYPGPAVAHLDQVDRSDAPERRQQREKRRLGVAVTAEPVRVGSVYFLERLPAGSPVQITPLEDPRRLLANAFVGYVHDAARLTRQLSLYATLSRSAHLMRAALPQSTHTEKLAAQLLDAGPMKNAER